MQKFTERAKTLRLTQKQEKIKFEKVLQNDVHIHTYSGQKTR